MALDPSSAIAGAGGSVALDPYSAIAQAVGSVAQAAAGIVTAKTQAKTQTTLAKLQVEQGTVQSIFGGGSMTTYLLVGGGVLLVLVVGFFLLRRR